MFKAEVVLPSLRYREIARGLVSDTNGNNWCLLSAAGVFGGRRE